MKTLIAFSALVGPRFVLRRTLSYLLDPSDPNSLRYRLQFFVQAGAGAVQTSNDGTHFGWGGGGGIDVLFSEYGGVRTQVDYVHNNRKLGDDNFVRISVGLIYRFEHEHKCPKCP